MKQFKPSKTIINQLVATTLISSFLLTTACSDGNKSWTPPPPPPIPIHNSIIVKKEKIPSLPTEPEETASISSSPSHFVTNSTSSNPSSSTTNLDSEESMVNSTLIIDSNKGLATGGTEEVVELEVEAKKVKGNLTESGSFSRAVKIGLSPNHTAPRTVTFTIDNITDSNGHITDDVKASFIDVTDIKDNKSSIRTIGNDQYRYTAGSEIDINEKSRQVRLNITRVKNLFNSDNDDHTKEFKINLIAHCSSNDAFNAVKHKLSIPISINNTGMTMGTHTTDGQPCEDINIKNWNDKNEAVVLTAYFLLWLSLGFIVIVNA